MQNRFTYAESFVIKSFRYFNARSQTKAMQIDIFQDFTKKNIVLWLAEIWLFLCSPRKFINTVSARSSEKILSQFLFYFIIYTASYLLLSNSTEFNSAIKPSILNIIFSIPIIIFFSVIAKIITGKTHIKEIFIFVIIANLTIGPLEIALLSVYLNSESQIYLIIYSFLHLSLVTYVFYGFGFIIQPKFLTGLKMIFLSIICTALIFLAIEKITHENNFQTLEATDNDLIFQEYKDLLSSISYSSTTPIKMNVMKGKEKLKTYHGIQDIYNSSVLYFNVDSIRKLKKTTQSNIAILTPRIAKLKFQRNISFFQIVLDYNIALEKELDSNYLNSKLGYVDELVINNKIPGEKFMHNLEFRANVGMPAYILMYNNQIVKLNRLNETITAVQEASPFLLGRIISNWINPNGNIYAKEPFLKLNQE